MEWETTEQYDPVSGLERPTQLFRESLSTETDPDARPTLYYELRTSF